MLGKRRLLARGSPPGFVDLGFERQAIANREGAHVAEQ
jgi:hypothetical protein